MSKQLYTDQKPSQFNTCTQTEQLIWLLANAKNNVKVQASYNGGWQTIKDINDLLECFQMDLDFRVGNHFPEFDLELEDSVSPNDL